MTAPAYPPFTGDEPCASTDPDAFFPEKGRGSSQNKKLRTICVNHCLMQNECLEWAIWYEGDGFWGGMTPRERRVVRRARGITKETVAA